MNSPATMTMTPMNNLAIQLQQIGLRALPLELDDFLARATKARWSPHVLLEQLAQAEIGERSRRSLERRLRLSGIKRSNAMSSSALSAWTSCMRAATWSWSAATGWAKP
jgi:hypothetical protein